MPGLIDKGIGASAKNIGDLYDIDSQRQGRGTTEAGVWCIIVDPKDSAILGR